MEAVKELIQIENLQVEIWRRSYQRSLNLRVRPDGLVRVTCGRGVPRRAVEAFVHESRDFIAKRVLELETLRRHFPEKKYLSDETFLFFGEAWPLDLIWTWTKRAKVRLGEGRIEMLAAVDSSRDDRRMALQRFYKKQARPHLEERLKYYSLLMGLVPRTLSIRGQRTRWGSCSADAQISLNWKLLAAPEWVIDYVVVHELAHIQHMNHSPRFWRLVEQYHPERQRARRWLRENEAAIARQF